MRPHNRHRCRLHLYDALPVGPISSLVHANPRLWPATSVFDAQPPSPVAGRLPPTHFFRPIESDTAAPSAGTGTDQLPGSITRTVRLPKGALAALFAD